MLEMNQSGELKGLLEREGLLASEEGQDGENKDEDTTGGSK